ncbi:MAG TPA: FG-GAP-like repeat-containing protein [Terracidiphilus sp.]
MLRYPCITLSVALAFPTLAIGSTVSFSSHTAACSSGLCAQTSIQHADLNGDGLEDLIALDHPNYGGFSVTFNQGNGAFSAPVVYTVPAISSGNPDSVDAVVFGDFSHHGGIDLAAFGADSDNLYVYTNNGRGAFTLTKTIPFTTGNIGFLSAVSADFNHDNNPDLAFTTDTQLHIFLGDGKGGFTPGLSQSVQGNTLQTGDFDGDGKADLLVTGDLAALNHAYAYYGDGTGHFPQWVTLAMSSGTYDQVAFSVGDVNSDGRSDVMVSDPSLYKSSVYVFYGNAANRNFPNRTTISISGCISYEAPTVADVDGNGYNDLIVTAYPCSNTSGSVPNLEVRTRNADSSYNAVQTIYSIPNSTADDNQIQQVLVLNGDHNTKPDLLFQQCLGQYYGSCSNGASTITLLNSTAGAFPTCNAPAAAEGISVCSPSTTAPGSPVTFNLGAAMATPARDMNVWVDGKKVAEQVDGFSNYTYLTKSLSLSPGTHQIGIYAAGWDQSTIHKSFTLTVQ